MSNTKSEFNNYKFLPDTSIIYNRKIIELIENNTLNKYQPIETDMLEQVKQLTIVLSRIMLAEIENQANQTKPQETVGLDVLHDLYRLKKEGIIDIEISGFRPTLDQIKLNPGGELDALIRGDAFKSKSILITADEVQSSVALVEGIDVFYVANLPEGEKKYKHQLAGAKIEDFFDDETMSVHLRGNCLPMAKRGKPGEWNLEAISEEELEPSEVAEIANRIVRQAKNDELSFIERNEPSVSVIQLRKYRIVICRPPFSDTYEVTAVKPLVSLTLDYYNLPDKFYERLEEAEGILVAGSPGAGKSTFISALAQFYLEKNKLVKTLESVRDLDVAREVSQYAPLNKSLEETADILLLIRPDFTIFDEVRTTSDFTIFADMRLAGVGLVGVVHASKPVDAIQRFIRRVELGMIPNIIDTVIFIEDGQVSEIMGLGMTVKKPTGFTDRDLSRPVIEVTDFVNNEVLYEMYEFGSNVVVTPVGSAKRRFHQRESAKSKYTYLKDYTNISKGKGIRENALKCSVYKRNKSYIIAVDPRFKNKYMNFYAHENLLFSATLNKYGELSIKAKSPVYQKIHIALRKGHFIEASLE